MQDKFTGQGVISKDRIIVQEYSLADFTFKVSSLVQQGYIPSEENEGYPMQLGMLYTCNMLKVKPAVEPSEQQEVQPEAKSRGRSKKV